ncbi:MAG: sugar ABC transporter permease [Ruminococcaceae bacterium]|nr:sugar ABC transporter permease [Oscillospiraceae bacterium]
MKMSSETSGIVTDVKKIWWIKINTKPIRRHALDGARFPHFATVKYAVDGVEFTKRFYISWRIDPPLKGTEVIVRYNSENPKRCKIDFDQEE